MKVDDIIKLLEAGFTKEEITALETGNAAEPKKEEPAKEEHAKEEPVKEEPKKEEQTAQDQSVDLLKLMVSKFEELTGAIHESNTKNSNNKTPEQTAPEELLANIIKPVKNK